MRKSCLFLLLKEDYKHLEAAILNQQKDKPHYELVVKSFAKLGINSKTPSRQEKIQFIDHMNQVLMDIKGFLCVL